MDWRVLARQGHFETDSNLDDKEISITAKRGSSPRIPDGQDSQTVHGDGLGAMFGNLRVNATLSVTKGM